MKIVCENNVLYDIVLQYMGKWDSLTKSINNTLV